MVDEADEKPGDDEMPAVFAHLDDKDWFLQSLIEMADMGVELGVTVSAQGLLVSGILISGKKYFAELSEEVKAGEGPHVTDEFLSVISRSVKQFVVIYEKPEGGATIGRLQRRPTSTCETQGSSWAASNPHRVIGECSGVES